MNGGGGPFPTTKYHDDFNGVNSLYFLQDLRKKSRETYYSKQPPYTPILNAYNEYFENLTAQRLTYQIFENKKEKLLLQTRIAKKITFF